MAGGMGRSGWGTLEQRLAQTAAASTNAGSSSDVTPGAEGPDRQDGTTPELLKHCWVEGPDGRVPGLLLGWRRDEVDGTWMGRVVRPVRMEGGAWWLLEDWLPAERLRPLS